MNSATGVGVGDQFIGNHNAFSFSLEGPRQGAKRDPANFWGLLFYAQPPIFLY